MGIFDKFKSQARNKGKQGSDTAEERINERTGGQLTVGWINDVVDRDRDRPEQQ